MKTEGHYRSWSGLKKQLEDLLCPALCGRITYFLTAYHDVHDSYGRAAIRLDGKELAVFSWSERITQDADILREWKKDGSWGTDALTDAWNRECVLSDYEFLSSAVRYLQMQPQDALINRDLLLRIFAVMDRRIGMRTLERVMFSDAYREEPAWVKQFFLLRLEAQKTEAETVLSH